MDWRAAYGFAGPGPSVCIRTSTPRVRPLRTSENRKKLAPKREVGKVFTGGDLISRTNTKGGEGKGENGKKKETLKKDDCSNGMAQSTRSQEEAKRR